MTPQRLRALRLSLRLSHAQFAAPLGVEASDIARWESGGQPLPDPFVLALAAAWVQLCVEAAAESRFRAPMPNAHAFPAVESPAAP